MAYQKKQSKTSSEPVTARTLGYNELARLVILAGIVIFAIINMGVFLNLVRTLLGVLSPVFIGIISAFILNLPLAWFEKKVLKGESRVMKKVKRPLSILFAFLLLLAVLTLMVLLIIPQAISAIREVTDQLPKLISTLQEWVMTLNIPALDAWVRTIDPSQLDLGAIFSRTGILAGGVFRSVTGVLGGLVNVVVGLGFAIFILLGKERLLHQIELLMTAFITPQRRAKLKYYIKVTTDIFSKYIFSQVIEALYMGVLTTAAMLLLGFPYATVVGPVTGLTSLIPMVGAFIGGALGFLLILTVDPTQALFFVVFIVVLQQLEGIFIYPRVVGKLMGLPQLWTFFAVVVGGALFGLPGSFFGVPAMTVFYRLMGENTRKRVELKERNDSSTYHILTIPKGRDPVRLNQPEISELVDSEVDTSSFKP